MIKAGIIGATGYAGAELVRLLAGHKDVDIVWYGSRSYINDNYANVYRNFCKIVDARCLDDNLGELADQADVIFTATPQGFLASVLTEEILEKTKVIDLSADFRIKDVAVYEKWYGIEHKSPQFLAEAVYGLCEINREKIRGARLVANPGCYTTCSILTAYPLAREGLIDMDTLIVDAKSGTSGAGRGAKVPNLFCEVNENIKAYGRGYPPAHAGDRGAAGIRGGPAGDLKLHPSPGAHEPGDPGHGVRLLKEKVSGRRGKKDL